MFFVAVAMCLGVASAYVCPPDACDGVQQPLLNCAGSVISKGGWCGCTDVCAKQLGESCQAGGGLLGRPSYGICESDLECVPHGEMVMLGYGRCQHKHTAKARLLTLQDAKTECEHRRIASLMSMVVWSGKWTPTCDAQGNFTPYQCDFGGSCFCVEPIHGTILTEKTHGLQATDC